MFAISIRDNSLHKIQQKLKIALRAKYKHI